MHPSEINSFIRVFFFSWQPAYISMVLRMNHLLFFTTVFATTSWIVVQASDPDILTDFILPPNSDSLNGSFFTFTGMRGVLDSSDPSNFKVTKAGMSEFQALTGQSVSFAVLQYPAGGVNPPHTHPRAAEHLFVVEGSLVVGFVDTANKLYTQTLELGDMFVFPKGLVHFQYNADEQEQATAISAFGSANAGTVSVPLSVFTTSIDDEILAKSFKTDVATIQKIKAGLGSKA